LHPSTRSINHYTVVKRENPRRDVPRRPINSRYSRQNRLRSQNRAALYCFCRRLADGVFR